MNWYKKAQIQNNEEIVQNTFEINVNFLNKITKKVTKLQRKAIQLGLPPMEFDVSDPYFKEIDNPRYDRTKPNSKKKIAIEVVSITIVGNSPKLDNWEIIGRIVHEEAGNVIRTIPGQTVQIPPQYRYAPPFCEHCNINRRRNDTFLVQNTVTKEFKQVGSSCLKDFLGHPDALRYAGMLQYYQGISDFLLSAERDTNIGGGGHTATELLPLLETASAVIRKFGYKKYDRFSPGKSTAQTVSYILFTHPRDEEERREIERYKQENQLYPTTEDTVIAERAISWGRNITEEEANKNNYLSNLKVILSQDYVNYANIGFAISSIYAMKNAEEREIEKERRRLENEKNLKSNFVGSPGQKILMKVSFDRENNFESNYGTRYVLKFTDTEGNKYTWFASNPLKKKIFDKNGEYDYDGYAEVGEELILFATIKNHKENEYKGNITKETFIYRGKIIEEKDISKISKKADIIKI